MAYEWLSKRENLQPNRISLITHYSLLITFFEMETLWQELTHGLQDGQHLLRVVIRLLAAMILGGIIGIQRERSGKAAGFRTHMMVCLGTAVFVITCFSVGMQFDALSRVIQGLVTGIGFIGAGTILKLEGEEEIKGLTTAAGIWMTAAIGITIGLGAIGVALMSTVLALVILALAQPLEDFFQKRRDTKKKGKPQSGSKINGKADSNYEV